MQICLAASETNSAWRFSMTPMARSILQNPPRLADHFPLSPHTGKKGKDFREHQAPRPRAELPLFRVETMKKPSVRELPATYRRRRRETYHPRPASGLLSTRPPSPPSSLGFLTICALLPPPVPSRRRASLAPVPPSLSLSLIPTHSPGEEITKKHPLPPFSRETVKHRNCETLNLLHLHQLRSKNHILPIAPVGNVRLSTQLGLFPQEISGRNCPVRQYLHAIRQQQSPLPGPAGASTALAT